VSTLLKIALGAAVGLILGGLTLILITEIAARFVQ
jgi:hypothetical protein